MALSMEEQRILAEIEQELARAEPALAARLAAFGRPRRAALLRSARSPRVLVVASLVALVLLTVLPVVVYALVSLRGLPRTAPARHPAVSAQHLTSVPR
jgi:Protein of unknown function (DUF3040)